MRASFLRESGSGEVPPEKAVLQKRNRDNRAASFFMALRKLVYFGSEYTTRYLTD